MRRWPRARCWAARCRRSTPASPKRCRVCAKCSSPPSGVVAVADHFWQALQGAQRVADHVGSGQQPATRQRCHSRVARKGRRSRMPGLSARADGDAAAALQSAKHSIARGVRFAAAGACHHGADELHRRCQSRMAAILYVGTQVQQVAQPRPPPPPQVIAGSKSESTPRCSAAASAGVWMWISFRRR
jgi:hypothetical protein